VARPLKERLPTKKASRQITKTLNDALSYHGFTHRDLADQIGKGRSYVQHWLGEHEPTLTFEAAHTLVQAAGVCGIINEKEQYRLFSLIYGERAKIEKPDYATYVVIGHPLKAIMRSFADVRLSLKTRSAIEERIRGALRYALSPASGDGLNFRLNISDGTLEALRDALRDLHERLT